MFTFRRKSKKEPDSTRVRTSPSLPELSSQGIPWPENLVDVAAIKETEALSPPFPQGAVKTSFQSVRGTIPFHKPFRGNASNGAPISSLYMASPPSAWEHTKGTTTAKRISQRRTRVPPTFNLMVVGSQGTGKTSLLRLLLETADLSPAATVDQRAAVDRFLRGAPKATPTIENASIEISESRFDRVLLTVIDTPGLEFQEGRELKLERQITSLLKYIDTQYADTMSEESKVVRASKGDQHVHLCIYTIDPASIMTAAARRALSSLPSKTRSEATISNRNPPDLVPDTSSADDSDDETEAPLTMSPADIKVIRRLSARTNVLPVIARADSLTDEKLHGIKQAVKKGLADAGLGFGIFGPSNADASAAPGPVISPTNRKTKFVAPDAHDDDEDDSEEDEDDEEDDEDEDEEDEDESRQSRTVIKLRPRPNPRHRSQSRGRRDLSQAAINDNRPQSPDPAEDNVANVRFSARVLAKTALTASMPFALIAPEPGKRRHRPLSSDCVYPQTPASPVPTSEDGDVGSLDQLQSPPPSIHNKAHVPPGPPEDLKGVYIRKFRWGTVDVLDPTHCDFAALRTAILSTHLKVLKTHTKEVLYEKYRTEKLLARRATQQITDDERHRLLQDLGL